MQNNSDAMVGPPELAENSNFNGLEIGAGEKAALNFKGYFKRNPHLNRSAGGVA